MNFKEASSRVEALRRKAHDAAEQLLRRVGRRSGISMTMAANVVEDHDGFPVAIEVPLEALAALLAAAGDAKPTPQPARAGSHPARDELLSEHAVQEICAARCRRPTS